AQRHRIRSADLAQRCEGAATPALALDEDVSPLTPREREVVTMAAGGLTSRDIADRLVVSVRTVDNLLHRAYVKLGVSSRKDAAAALGLTRPDPSAGEGVGASR
ncbi:MAG: helix-turn-helix domain-containing protein, partial [Nitriliruptorales bacterium]